MSEINVQQHNRRLPFWYLGVIAIASFIVVVLLIWVLFVKPAKTTDSVATTEPAAVTTAADEGVQAFVSFVRDNPAEANMALGHNYTSDGIRYLAAALSVLVNRDGAADQEIERKLSALKQKADRLQENWRSTQHADIIRDAFILAADVMATLQQKQDAELSVQIAQVRQAAEAISSDRLALEQRVQVREFFSRASTTLQNMSQSPD
jgi:hypothetical protein